VVMTTRGVQPGDGNWRQSAGSAGRSRVPVAARRLLPVLLAAVVLAGQAPPPGVELREGAIVRGPVDRKRLALVFTGHEFAEGGDPILDALGARTVRASFFLTGVFLRNEAFAPLVHRMVREGHYVGAHSDEHLLYCPWEG